MALGIGIGISLSLGSRASGSSAPALRSKFLAKNGLSNLIVGSPDGDLVAQGGAFTIDPTGSPNGGAAYKCQSAVGGILVSTNTDTLNQPHQIIAVVKTTSVVADACMFGSKTGAACSSTVTSANKFRMAAGVPTGGLDSAVVDPTLWHVIDQVWHSTISLTSVDGSAYLQGNPSTFARLGLSIGGQGDGSGVRWDGECVALYYVDGRLSYSDLQAVYAEIDALTGLNVSPPASYADPTAAPQLSSRPSLWSATTPMVCWFGGGQSNELGRGDTPTDAFGANTYKMGDGWVVEAAAHPVSHGSVNTIIDPVQADSSVTYGYQSRFCNTVSVALNRDICFVECAVSGTSSDLWKPLTGTRAHLLGALIARIKEAQSWGQIIGGVNICQGEADSDPVAWLANWTTSIAYVRAVVGLPSLQFYFIQPTGGVRASVAAIAGIPNVFYIATDISAPNMQAGGVHFNATGYGLVGDAVAASALANTTIAAATYPVTDSAANNVVTSTANQVVWR